MVVDLVQRRWLTKQHEIVKNQLLVKTKEQFSLNRELVSLIDTANAPIFAVDRDLKVTTWNHKVSMLTGIPPSQIFGQSIRTLFEEGTCAERDAERSAEAAAEAKAKRADSDAVMLKALTSAAIDGKRVECFQLDFYTQVR